MINIKSKRDIEYMKTAGELAATLMQQLGESIKEGITTLELDQIAEKFIKKHGTIASFKGYGGFPKSICTSINEEVVHGIPSSKRVLRNGDIISIDLGVQYKGFHSDMAKTFPVGNISKEAENLINTTRESFYEGLKMVYEKNRIGDLSSAIQKYVEGRGFSVVRDLIGHGVGEKLHEKPDVPNFGVAGKGPRFVSGMTIAIEPMVNVGTARVAVLDDEWTVVTGDRKLSAHYEHTVLVTNGEPVILTK